MTKKPTSKKTTRKPKVVLTLREQIKAMAIEQIRINTKSINEQLIEAQKPKEDSDVPKTKERIRDELMSEVLFEDFCSDYRKGISKILSQLFGEEDHIAYRGRLKEIYEEKQEYQESAKNDKLDLSDSGQRFKPLTLLSHTARENSHDYNLHEIALVYNEDNTAYQWQDSRDRIVSGNNVSRYISDLEPISDEDITAFIENDLFDKYLDRIMKEDSIKMLFFESKYSKEYEEYKKLTS